MPIFFEMLSIYSTNIIIGFFSNLPNIIGKNFRCFLELSISDSDKYF